MTLFNANRNLTLAVFGLVFTLLFSSFSSATVFINEVMANSSQGQLGEWVELYNNDSSAVDLSGWTIETATSGTLTLNLTIQANSYLLLVNDFNTFDQQFPGLTDPSSVIEYGQALPAFNLSLLSNSLTLTNATAQIEDNLSYTFTSQDATLGRYTDGTSNIITLSTQSPLAENDNEAPYLTSWDNPSRNATNVSGIVNISVTLSDDTTSINSSTITLDGSSFNMEGGDSGVFHYVWTTPQNTTTDIFISFNDSYGQQTNVSLLGIVADNIVPTGSFATLVSGQNISGAFNLSLNAADAHTGVRSVTIRNGTGNLLTLSQLDSNIWQFPLLSLIQFPDGAVTLTFNVTDHSSNNATGSLTVIMDSTAPSVSITSPTNGSNSRGQLSLTISASDAISGIRSVEIRNGSNGWITLPQLSGNLSNGVYNTSFDTSAVLDGSITFIANVTDFAGNSNSGVFHTTTIDNTLPFGSILSPLNSTNLSGSVQFLINAQDAISGVSSVSISRGSTSLWQSASLGNGNATNGNYTATINTALLSDGNHSFTLNITDSAGNSNVGYFHTALVDNTVPQLLVMSPQNESNLTSVVTLRIQAIDALSGIKNVQFLNSTAQFIALSIAEGSINSGNWTLSLDTASFAGPVTFLVNATDFSGNSRVLGSELLLNYTIDNAAPAVSVLLPESGFNASGTLSVSVFAADSETGVHTLTMRNGSLNTIAMQLTEGSLTDANWSATLDTRAIADGALVLTFNATDFVGISNASQSITLVVDNTNPYVSTFIQPSNGASLKGTVVLNASSFDSLSGVQSVRFLLNNGLIIASNESGSWNASVDTTLYTDGAYNITALVNDFAGNDGLDNVVISEVMFDGPGSDASNGNEWVELYNPTNQTIDVTGWDFIDAQGLVYDITSTVQIDPRSSVIIAENATFFTQNYGQAVVFADDVFGSAGNGLTDSGENLTLRNTLNQPIDYVAWGNNSGWLVSASANRTLARSIAARDTNAPSDFLSNQTPNPGSVNNADFITVIFDNQAPAIDSINGVVVNGSNLSGMRLINISATDAITSVNSVVFTLHNSTDSVTTFAGVNTAGNHWTSALNTTAFADGSYTINIFTNDTAGNSDVQSNISIVIDNTAPLSFAHTPANLTFINTTTNINITVLVNDTTSSLNLSSLSFRLNNVPLTLTSVEPTQNGALASYVALGPYFNGNNFSAQISGRDYAGNLHTSTWTFALDTVIPRINSESVNDSDLKVRSSDSVRLTINSTNGLSGVNSVKLLANGIENVLTSLGSGLFTLNSTVSALGCTTDGNCSLAVNSTDFAGNMNATHQIVLLVDNTNPSVVNYIVNDSDLKVRSNQPLTFNATISDANFDSGSSVTIRNGSSSVALSLIETSGLNTNWGESTTASALGCALDGACTVYASATDIVGNQNGSELITLTIDNTAPAINAITTDDTDRVLRSSAYVQVTINTTDLNSVVNVTINSTSLAQISTDLWQINATAGSLCPSVNNSICTLGVIATDNVSNTNSSVTFTLSIDETNPIFVSVNTTDSDGIVGSTDSVTFTANVTDMFNASSVTLNGTSLTQVNALQWSTTNSTAQFGCSAEGSCTLAYIATDKAGNMNTQTLTLTIDNTAPQLVSFIQTPATIYNTAPVVLRADFTDGNGIGSVTFEHNATGTLANYSGTQIAPGNFTLTFNVSARQVVSWKAYGVDNAGRLNGSMAAQQFAVSNRAPTNATLPDLTWQKDQNATLNLSQYFSDPDSDALVYSTTGAANISFNVNNASGIATFISDVNFFGVRTLQVVASDGLLSNVSNTITLNVTYVNTLSPQITNLPNFTITEDSYNASINLSDYAFDADTNDEDLAWSAIGNSSVKVSINADKILNISSTPNFNGQEIIVLLASDGEFQSSSNSVVVRFTAVNDAPSAPVLLSPSNASNVSNSSLVLDWAPSTDAEGNLTTYTLYFGNLSNPLFNLTTNDTNATVNNLTKGATYYWKVEASDSALSSNSTLLQFNAVNNRAPTLSAAIPNTSIVEDTTTSSVNLNSYFADEDGDVLIFSAVNSTNVSAQINSATGAVTLVPAPNATGITTISFSAFDGVASVSSNPVRVNITNVNDAPAITSVSPASGLPSIAAQVGSQQFSITALDADLGDVLTTSWTRNGTQFATGTNSVTVTSLASGMYLITATVTDVAPASTSYSWLLNVTGEISGNGLVSDVLALNETARQSVVNPDVNSTAGGNLVSSIQFSGTLNFSGVVNLEDAFNVSNGFISVNSDMFRGLNRSAALTMNGLTFTKAPLIMLASGFESTAGAVVCPATICTNVAYNTATGQLTFNVAHFSTYFTAANGTNGAPVITSTAPTSAQSGVQFTYSVSANDPDSDALTYSLITAPSGMSVSGSTIRWTPTSAQLGSTTVTVRASDGSLTADQTFTVMVTPGPKLAIEEVDVKVDGKSSNNLVNGSSISKDAEPGDKVQFKVRVANMFDDLEDLDIDDVEVDIRIEDIEDGDDYEDEANEFDLDQGRTKTVTFTYDVPLNVDEDSFDVVITAEGVDSNGTARIAEVELSLDVEKKNHELRLLNVQAYPSVIRCEKSIRLSTDVLNTGAEDEDEVVLTFRSPALGLSASQNTEIDSGSEDNKYSYTGTALVPSDLAVGVHTIDVAAFYDSTRLADETTLSIEKRECVEVKKSAQVSAPKTDSTTVVSQPTTTATTKQPIGSVASGTQGQKKGSVAFGESDEYVFLLLTAFMALLAVALVGFAAVVIKILRRH